jgi:hypothetical protein
LAKLDEQAVKNNQHNMPNIFDQLDQPTAAPNAAVQTATLNPQSSILAADRVAVRRPDGSTTTIPAIHLKAAIQYATNP